MACQIMTHYHGNIAHVTLSYSLYRCMIVLCIIGVINKGVKDHNYDGKLHIVLVFYDVQGGENGYFLRYYVFEVVYPVTS